jgi:hypothetical protein
MDEQQRPTNDTLRVQLVELNNRGRQYGGQIWQVPFAYVGIVGVVLARTSVGSANCVNGCAARKRAHHERRCDEPRPSGRHGGRELAWRPARPTC